MPIDSLLVTLAILAVFGFFAAVLVWADLTWQPRRIVRQPVDVSQK